MQHQRHLQCVLHGNIHTVANMNWLLLKVANLAGCSFVLVIYIYNYRIKRKLFNSFNIFSGHS